MIKEAYGYTRVSGRKQIDGHGFERQEQAIKAFCKKSQIQLVRIFKEQVSGTRDETARPEFSEMVAEILSNGVRAVVVESLDRFAREYRIQEELLIYLASRNIDLVSANTGENVTQAIKDSPTKKALVQMQGVFAELDKSLLVRRLQKARDKARKDKGRCEGQLPYGYDPARPQEAQVLKRVRYARRKSKYDGRKKSFQAIADELNADGITTRQGKRWDAALVFNILRKRKATKKRS